MKTIYGRIIAIGRSAFIGPVLVGLIVVAVIILMKFAAFPTPVHAASQSTVLAKGTLPPLGGDNFIFSVVNTALDPDEAKITHKHSAGMVYALNGPHSLMIIGGKLSILDPGQASWIDDQILHTHGTNGKTPSHFLVMSLRAVDKKDTPTTPNFPNINPVFESDALTLASQQVQDVVLTRTSYNTNEDNTMTLAGPTMFFIESGEFTINIGNTTHLEKAGEYIVAPTSALIKIHANEGQSGDILALSVIPAAGHPVLFSQDLITPN